MVLLSLNWLISLSTWPISVAACLGPRILSLAAPRILELRLLRNEFFPLDFELGFRRIYLAFQLGKVHGICGLFLAHF